MTARQNLADLITVSDSSVPLAADLTSPPDVRLEDLLQGQQEILSLVLGGASLQDVVTRMVSIVENAFRPARCAISLFQRGDPAVKCQASPNLSADLLSTVGASVGEYLLDPTATAALSGERIIVNDFTNDARWPEHAALALAQDLRCCWVEPIVDCGEGLFGMATLYFPDRASPMRSTSASCGRSPHSSVSPSALPSARRHSAPPMSASQRWFRRSRASSTSASSRRMAISGTPISAKVPATCSAYRPRKSSPIRKPCSKRMGPNTRRSSASG